MPFALSSAISFCRIVSSRRVDALQQVRLERHQLLDQDADAIGGPVGPPGGSRETRTRPSRCAAPAPAARRRRCSRRCAGAAAGRLAQRGLHFAEVVVRHLGVVGDAVDQRKDGQLMGLSRPFEHAPCGVADDQRRAAPAARMKLGGPRHVDAHRMRHVGQHAGPAATPRRPRSPDRRAAESGRCRRTAASHHARCRRETT